MLSINEKIIVRTDVGFVLGLIETIITEETIKSNETRLKVRCFLLDETEEIKVVKEKEVFRLDEDYSSDSYSIKGWLKTTREWEVMMSKFKANEKTKEETT